MRQWREGSVTVCMTEKVNEEQHSLFKNSITKWQSAPAVGGGVKTSKRKGYLFVQRTAKCEVHSHRALPVSLVYRDLKRYMTKFTERKSN